jgi:hypothetical protein
LDRIGRRWRGVARESDANRHQLSTMILMAIAGREHPRLFA